MRGRWAARALLAGYAVFLVVALFSPASDRQSAAVIRVSRALVDLGFPYHVVSYGRMEVVMNAVIIAPLGALGMFAFPRTTWQQWTAYAFLGSCVVELTQGLMLPGREASFSDIVANTAGGLVGSVMVRVVLRRFRPRAGRAERAR